LTKRMLLLLYFCAWGIAGASAQNFNHFNFNVGGGYGGATGDVGKLTGASYNGVVGGGWNFSRRVGVKAEYMYYNLSFKDSVKLDQVPGANGRLQSATLNLFYQVSQQGKTGVYVIGGGGWYQRYVDARSQFLPQGTVCQPAWQLWGIDCTTSNLVDPAQTLTSHSASGGGYNFGGGITYRITKRMRFYVEGRYHHAYTADLHTSVFPVTAGLRW